MARMLDFFLDRKTNRYCKDYTSFNDLFTGLQKEESGAIQCLSARVSGSITRFGKQYNLVAEDIEELICDCITLFIQKIRDEKYEFVGYDPSTYVIEIAKNKARTFQRSALRGQTANLDPALDIPYNPEPGTYADLELIGRLLGKLNENCRKLIHIKYLDEQKDKDVIEQKLTQYTTVDALKNHRAQCMKKLIDLAGQIQIYQG